MRTKHGYIFGRSRKGETCLVHSTGDTGLPGNLPSNNIQKVFIGSCQNAASTEISWFAAYLPDTPLLLTPATSAPGYHMTDFYFIQEYRFHRWLLQTVRCLILNGTGKGAFMCPNNSLAASSLLKPRNQYDKWLALLLLCSCMRLATYSLPLPLSPSIKTEYWFGATSLICFLQTFADVAFASQITIFSIADLYRHHHLLLLYNGLRYSLSMAPFYTQQNFIRIDRLCNIIICPGFMALTAIRISA